MSDVKLLTAKTDKDASNIATIEFLQALYDGDSEAEAEFFDDRAIFEEYGWDGLG
jgi:hypothetical protein